MAPVLGYSLQVIDKLRNLWCPLPKSKASVHGRTVFLLPRFSKPMADELDPTQQLRALAAGISTHRGLRRTAAEWIALVAALVGFCVLVVWAATRNPYVRPLKGPWADTQLCVTVAGEDKHQHMSVRLLHEDPCIRFVSEFLTSEEVQHLISFYKHMLTPSTVSGDKDKQEAHPSRTSSSAYLPAGSANDVVLKAIENRLVILTGIPLPYWETLQLTHYKSGQQYKPHFDWFPESSNNRTMTVFVYLNDIPPGEGGSTHFPRLGLNVQPQARSALIWHNCLARGNQVHCEENTEHAGTPPTRGEKYGLNCWARTAPYRS